MYIHTVNEAIRVFRQTLPANSNTAAAIDRQDGLAAISQCATQEGVHALAALLFQVQLAELYDTGESEPIVHVTNALQQFRQHLPTASKTAAALERHASWQEISQCAEAEGLRQHPVVSVLCAAEQERLRRPRRVHAPLPSPRRRRRGVAWLLQQGRGR